MVCFKIFVPPKERGKYRRARSAPIIPPKQAKRDGLKEKFTNLSLKYTKVYILIVYTGNELENTSEFQYNRDITGHRQGLFGKGEKNGNGL